MMKTKTVDMNTNPQSPESFNPQAFVDEELTEPDLKNKNTSPMPGALVEKVLKETTRRVHESTEADTIGDRVQVISNPKMISQLLTVHQRKTILDVCGSVFAEKFEPYQIMQAISFLRQKGFEVVHFADATYTRDDKKFAMHPLVFGALPDKKGAHMSASTLIVETAKAPDSVFVPQGKELKGVASTKRNDPFDTEIRAVHNSAHRYDRMKGAIPAASRTFQPDEVQQVLRKINKKLDKNDATVRLLSPMEWELLRLGGVIEPNANGTGELFDNRGDAYLPELLESVSDKYKTRFALTSEDNPRGSVFRVAFELEE